MSENTFRGIDYELVDLIYLPEKEKLDYLNQVSNVIKKLGITESTSYTEAIEKIVNEEDEILFIREVLLFTYDLPFSQRTLHNKYYTLCNLCQFNLAKKLDSNFYDFKLEESLILEVLKCDLHNYARIQTLFSFGETFSAIGQIDKRNYYFDLIAKESFDISPSTITDFYKMISEIYISNGDKKTALDWLKRGIQINPGFPVKRKIKELEFDCS